MRNWTEEETNFLLNNYTEINIQDIASKLNRSRASVIGKASKLRIQEQKPRKIFTEKDFLDAIETSKNHKEAASKLGYKFSGGMNSKGLSQYAAFFQKLQPNTDHFELASRSLSNNAGFSIESLYNSYKRESTNRDKDFTLNIEEFTKLVSQNCYYCGGVPSSRRTSNYKTHKTEIIYTGIDRKDNNIGYIVENCVPCCKYCNKMKSTMNFDRFLDQVKKIYEYQQQKTKPQQAS